MIHQIQQHKKELLFIFKCIIIMGLICLCLYQPMMQLFENPQQLRQQLQNYGLWGQVFFICIMILQVIFVFLPGEIVEIMAGFDDLGKLIFNYINNKHYYNYFLRIFILNSRKN